MKYFKSSDKVKITRH